MVNEESIEILRSLYLRGAYYSENYSLLWHNEHITIYKAIKDAIERVCYTAKGINLASISFEDLPSTRRTKLILFEIVLRMGIYSKISFYHFN